jgi:hypothetical protein
MSFDGGGYRRDNVFCLNVFGGRTRRKEDGIRTSIKS